MWAQRELRRPKTLWFTWAVTSAFVVGGLGFWQWAEYNREKAIWARNLEFQGGAILSAIIGGIKGHRRMGQFFWEQVDGMLTEIAALPHVKGVGILSEEGNVLIVKSQAREVVDALGHGSNLLRDSQWRDDGLWLKQHFTLTPETPVPGAGGSRRGDSRGPWWREPYSPLGKKEFHLPAPSLPSPFSAGGNFQALLVLSRTDFDSQCRRAAVLRALIVGLSSLLALACLMATGAYVQRQKLARSQDLLTLEVRHQEALAAAAAGLAHETRNPLNMIRMRAQTLIELAEGEVAAAAAAIVEECDRLATRINQFLSFASPLTPEADWVDCEELLQELHGVLQPDLQEAGVCLRWEIAPQVRRLRVDRELFRQVLFNLLTNAVAFSPPNESVEVRIVPGGKKWKMEVLDKGPGVPEENRARLFTPYFSTRPHGTGLGLAIVARICTVCGWEVSYCPRPGGGACFRIVGPHESLTAHNPHRG